VLDFGLAKLRKLDHTGGSDATTKYHGAWNSDGAPLGYMSPEQATGDEVDFRL